MPKKPKRVVRKGLVPEEWEAMQPGRQGIFDRCKQLWLVIAKVEGRQQPTFILSPERETGRLREYTLMSDPQDGRVKVVNNTDNVEQLDFNDPDVRVATIIRCRWNGPIQVVDCQDSTGRVTAVLEPPKSGSALLEEVPNPFGGEGNFYWLVGTKKGLRRVDWERKGGEFALSFLPVIPGGGTTDTL